MSGILDSKSRMIDAILTSEGRRQMAEGTFGVSYVTFTDSDVAYEYDASNGHVDPTSRIYLEACNLPQDQITFEANDEGKLRPLRSQDITVSSPDRFLGSTSQAALSDGRLLAYEVYHGRKIRVSSIFENQDDKNKGFIYSDSATPIPLTASVLVDPNIKAGSLSFSTPSPGSPYVSYIGTKGGLSGREFALAISGAISTMTNASGPAVFPSVAEDIVYLDSGQSITNTLLFSTGTLSSPVVIEDNKVGSRLNFEEIQSAAFSTQIQGILTSSIDNFIELQPIASIDRFFEDQNFELSTHEISFDLSGITNKTTLASVKSPPSVNEIDSLFNDDKLSHLDNFLYLPPIIKTSTALAPDKTNIENLITRQRLLGDYPSWGDNEKKLTLQNLKIQIEKMGIPGRNIEFIQSSRNNNIIGQIFEIAGDTVSKLDIVDFGYVYNDEKKTQEKIFFVGKVFLDNRGTACFVNMFTLNFSSNEGGI